MRLDVSLFGILACLTGLVVADDDDRGSGDATGGSGGTATTGSSSNLVILMDALPTPAVYSPKQGNQTFHYKRGITELDVFAVYLRRYDDGALIGQGDIKNGTYTSTGTKFSDEETLEQRQAPQALPPFHFTATQDSVELPISNDLSQYGSNLGQPLYYEFQWKNSTAQGSSYSQIIAVSSDADFAETNTNLSEMNMGSSPAKPESITSSSENPTTSTAASPAAETSVEAGTQGSSGSGGLNTGAIAGIAVGCSIAGLLIIAFVVWFFFFRRRNNGDRIRGDDYAADSRTHAMMPTKEVVDMSQSSPHSAFANDGGRLHDPRSSIARGEDNASYVPYSDRGRSTSPPLPLPGAALAANNSQTDVASTTRSPSPPFHSRYAHLIEEGMTEEEIRRLEEEERHLDAAIEDAGRGSRQT